MFATLGVDEDIEFLDDPPAPTSPTGVLGNVTVTYDGADGVEAWMTSLARDCRFQVTWADLGGDIGRISERLPFVPDEVEVVSRRFYRGQAAYVVGELRSGEERVAFALAIRHRPGGLYFAALMLGEEDVSILFSYTRAAFLVATRAPTALVEFLGRLLPHRSPSELWASIGFRKQAKSERYRELRRYLDSSADSFVPARGVKGLVMIVFTLPGFEVVFKVIRDRFPPQKNVTRTQVAERYQLVARHDRAGRLVEAQRFHDLALPRDRFDPPLLDELLQDASRTVSIRGDDVMFRTVYLERRVTPLDVYIRATGPSEAQRAIVDYGTAIKNLAASNIFPGDMLLKNFGVTSRGRVVFYDYDELTQITACRFKPLPDHDIGDPVAGVGPNDVFPEELPRFLGLSDEMRAAFDEQHADLFEPAFWNAVQHRLTAGEIIEILPYRKSRRL